MKHVVQYGVFAAYHLALETSFLADEGASLPEHLFDESLTVALSNKSLNIDCSISLVPGFTFPAHEKQGNFGEPEAVNTMSTSLHNVATVQNTELIKSLSLPSNTILKDAGPVLICSNITSPSSKPSDIVSGSEHCCDDVASILEVDKENYFEELMISDAIADDFCEQLHAPLEDGHSESQESMDVTSDYTCIAENISGSNKTGSEAICLQQDAKSVLQNQPGSLKEAFPKSISDAQSILVSLSSRCVWKGTVCERSHVLRIKYYGSFDKPLGRFLQDQLFDQVNSS